jgi:hypothetical protein
VGKQKAFVLQGYGIDDNDAVRFVPHGNNNNDDCTTSLPLNTGGYTGDLVTNNVFATTFVTPSRLAKPHMLCVRFNQEPWSLVRPVIAIKAAQLESASGNYGGALLNVATKVVREIGLYDTCWWYSLCNSPDHMMKIQARITLTGECIRTCIFLCLFYV